MKRALALSLLLAAACGDGGVQRRSGLEALMQVAGAQYFPGELPAGSDSGPSVQALRVISQTLRVGQTNRVLSGAVAKDGLSVALKLDGDEGYWVKPSGPSDAVLPDALSFEANLAFSRFITAGEHDLKVIASNAAGTWGQPSPIRFTFVDLNAAPAAALRIALSWDVDADLDLHVIDPTGVEIWSRKSSTYEPPVVGPIDQAAADASGRLDFDSNSQCVIDGRRLENVLYGKAPPSGHYTVRVDTFSLCNQAAARWKLEVFSNGELLTSSTGESLPSATRFPHERGAGLLAAEFTLP